MNFSLSSRAWSSGAVTQRPAVCRVIKTRRDYTMSNVNEEVSDFREHVFFSFSFSFFLPQNKIHSKSTDWTRMTLCEVFFVPFSSINQRRARNKNPIKSFVSHVSIKWINWLVSSLGLWLIKRFFSQAALTGSPWRRLALRGFFFSCRVLLGASWHFERIWRGKFRECLTCSSLSNRPVG